MGHAVASVHVSLVIVQHVAFLVFSSITFIKTIKSERQQKRPLTIIEIINF